MNNIPTSLTSVNRVELSDRVLSGLTVAMALILSAVCFALIAGLSPLTWSSHACIYDGLVTSILGGRPGMILGATGASCCRDCNPLLLFME